MRVHVDPQTCRISMVDLLAPAVETPAVLEQSAGGVLLPPGVAEKLSARAAVDEAQAVVEALPVRRADDQLLAAVEALQSKVAALEAEIGRLEQRTPAAVEPNAAGQLLASEPLFVDVETTGLRKDEDQVVEIAIMNAAGEMLLNTLVNPGRPMPAAAAAVNGIDDAMLANAPDWAQVEPLARELLAGRVCVAHYAQFDAKFLPDLAGEWVCSKKLADQLLGKPARGQGKLLARLEQLGIEAEAGHFAGNDVENARRLVLALAQL